MSAEITKLSRIVCILGVVGVFLYLIPYRDRLVRNDLHVRYAAAEKSVNSLRSRLLVPGTKIEQALREFSASEDYFDPGRHPLVSLAGGVLRVTYRLDSVERRVLKEHEPSSQKVLPEGLVFDFVISSNSLGDTNETFDATVLEVTQGGS